MATRSIRNGMISSLTAVVWFFMRFPLCKGVNVSNSGGPLVIPPSGEWDGPDGPWSSFDLGAGLGMQTFRGFPTISQPAHFLPSNVSWCDMMNTKPSICERRGLFQPSKSTSWVPASIWGLPFPFSPYTRGGEDVTGNTGIDTTTWGSTDRDVQFSKQVIVFTASEDFPMALFGLGSTKIQYGNGSTKPFTMKTPLDTLCDMGAIQTQSYGYNAGSRHRNQSASLILGGYDRARIANSSTGVSYSMNSDVRPGSSPSVRVSSVSIMANTQTVVVEAKKPSVAIIDSAIPYICLPLELCDAFESAFDIEWNDTLAYYTISDTSHNINFQQNASVIISLLSDDDHSTTNFTLPYQALVQQLSYPLIDKTGLGVRYFPLRRPLHGNNGYVLGRAFLQETYIVVNNDAQNFDIYQAAFQGNADISVIAKAPDATGTVAAGPPSTPTDTTLSNGTHPFTKPTKPRLTAGAYAGIGVGSAASLILLAIAGLVWHRRAKKSRPLQQQEKFDKSELEGEGKPRIEVMSASRGELDNVEPEHEVAGSQLIPWELEGTKVPIHELGHSNDTEA